MAAGKYNFYIEQGSTFATQVVYKDSAGNPVDASGTNARMQIRPAANSPTILLSLVGPTGSLSGSGINMSQSDSGSLAIFIDSDTTALMSNWGTAYYDLEIFTTGSGIPIVTRLLQGQVKLSQEVSR